MSVRRVTTMVLACGLALAAPALADDREGALLAAWERVQREDPETVRFEPVEPGLYAFETTRFPYDGRLRVLNLAVDETGAVMGDPFVLGFVEVELPDAPADFFAKFAQSYAMWQSRSTFYLDPESGAWLTSREWQERQGTGACSLAGTLLLGNWFWIAFLVVLVIVLWRVTRRAGRQFDSAMQAQDKALSEQERAILLTERAVRIGEDSNRLLGEILAELRGGRG